MASKEQPACVFCTEACLGAARYKFSHYTETECCIVVPVQHFNHKYVTSARSVTTVFSNFVIDAC
jgi:hypothetical protein